MSGGAWCKASHDRTGLVSNQDLGAYDKSRPLVSVATCDRPECLAKAKKYVAGNSNETAVYYDDAARRAAVAATS